MKADDLFPIIRYGTYEQYEKGISDVDINTTDGDYNFLGTAIAYCKDDIAKDLIARNININYQGTDDVTPLHLCAMYDNFEIAKLLLQKQAEINVYDYYGNNPLWYAVFEANKTEDYRMVKLFLEHGADIHHKNKADRSPLDLEKKVNDTALINLLTQFE